MSRFDLSDEEWALVFPHIPVATAVVAGSKIRAWCSTGCFMCCAAGRLGAFCPSGMVPGRRSTIDSIAGAGTERCAGWPTLWSIVCTVGDVSTATCGLWTARSFVPIAAPRELENKVPGGAGRPLIRPLPWRLQHEDSCAHGQPGGRLGHAPDSRSAARVHLLRNLDEQSPLAQFQLTASSPSQAACRRQGLQHATHPPLAPCTPHRSGHSATQRSAAATTGTPAEIRFPALPRAQRRRALHRQTQRVLAVIHPLRQTLHQLRRHHGLGSNPSLPKTSSLRHTLARRLLDGQVPVARKL